MQIFQNIVEEDEPEPCRSSPCKNHGTCKKETNGYSCSCLQGYSGEICQGYQFRCEILCLKLQSLLEDKLGACGSNPCKNSGSCRDANSGYTCSCRDGYSGQNCQGNEVSIWNLLIDFSIFYK